MPDGGARHTPGAIGIWVAFVVIAVLAGGAMGTIKLHEGDKAVGEAGRATATIARAFPQHSSENILFRSDTKVADDPDYRAAIREAVAGITATGLVSDVRSPLDPANGRQITPDGTAALITTRSPPGRRRAATRTATPTA